MTIAYVCVTAVFFCAMLAAARYLVRGFPGSRGLALFLVAMIVWALALIVSAAIEMAGGGGFESSGIEPWRPGAQPYARDRKTPILFFGG